jgi:ectoine hydroxylase-related dioxygenase (phytanoyl-CoA dioxygenase family)
VLSKVIVAYDTARYPFARLVSEHLEVDDLSLLHDEHAYPLFTRETDQTTPLHRQLYEIGEIFYETYRAFVHDEVRRLVGENVVYQRKPSFRFQLPGNIAVGNFHRDRDNFHDVTEINFWVPLTRVTADTAVWVESREGERDFRPCLLEYGEMLVFDGANLEHGNRVNRSDRTRLSFDFRVVPEPLFRDSDKRSLNTKMRFALGDYFERAAPVELREAEATGSAPR